MDEDLTSEEKALIKELISVTSRGSTDIRAAVRALEKERANHAALTARLAVTESQIEALTARVAALEAQRDASHRLIDLVNGSPRLQAALAAILVLAGLSLALNFAPTLPTVLALWRPLVP